MKKIIVGLMVLIGVQALAAVPLNASVTKQVEAYLSQMTLEEKADQLTGANTNDDRWSNKPGAEYHTVDNDRLGIPGFKMGHTSSQMKRGSGRHMNGTTFPAPIARAASWDVELERKIGAATALELRAANQNNTMGPTLNIARDLRNGRVFEAYGEDPYLTSRMGVAFTLGTQSEGVIACPKHFVANYRETGRNGMNCIIDERTLNEIYYPAYKACIQEGGAGSIMSAYNCLNGKRCSESAELLRDTLRDKWGFRGFVLSDYSFAVTDTKRAVEGGLNVEMHMPKKYGPALVKAVHDGLVKESDVDDLVREVLRVKIEFGLFDQKKGDVPESVIHQEEHIALSYESAIASQVLLKNNGTLPLNLKRIKKISVIGDALEQNPYGDGSAGIRRVPEYEVLFLDQLRKTIGDKVTISTTLDDDADVVLVLMKYPKESEGNDRFDLTLDSLNRSEQTKEDADMQALLDTGGEVAPKSVTRLEFINQAVSKNPSTVVVLFGGSAIRMDPWLEKVAAVHMAWYLGEQTGPALVNTLLGKVNPSGKLPISFPHSVNDMAITPEVTKMEASFDEGIFVGYRYFDAQKKDPLFHFGYGLSYTTFEISNLNCVVQKDRSCALSVQVTNTGKKEGAEVVQVYVHDPLSKVKRPPVELKSFAKVHLKPGESKTVKLILKPEDFMYYDVAVSDFVLEPGAFEIRVGSSSRTIAAKQSITIP